MNTHSRGQGVVLGCSLFFASLWAPIALAQFPQNLDGDGDGFVDLLELGLQSDPGDSASTPESRAVADTCNDGSDNDGDGAVDKDDPGCEELLPSTNLAGRMYAFRTIARLDPGALGPGLPPAAIQAEGPAVMATSDPAGGHSELRIVAMQLRSDTPSGPVFLVQNPDVASSGFVGSNTGIAPFESEIVTNLLQVSGGETRTLEPVEVSKSEIPFLPPVQDSREVNPRLCYQFQGGTHCPIVPPPVPPPVVRIPVYKWTAKFDCGEQPSTPPPFLGAVKPGDYATKIVIHNPQGGPVQFKKKVSVGERNPKTGQISDPARATLPPWGTTEVDCPDIYRLLHRQLPQKAPLPFINGVVTIVSQSKLDVIANYTLETPKEKVEFEIDRPKKSIWKKWREHGHEPSPELQRLFGRQLKTVTLITEDTLIDLEQEVRAALIQWFPADKEMIPDLRIRILSDDIGVGSSIDVEAIKPQKCVQISRPKQPKGKLRCPA